MKVCGDCNYVVAGPAECHCNVGTHKPVGFLQKACERFEIKEENSMEVKQVYTQPNRQRCEEVGCKSISRANHTSYCQMRTRCYGQKTVPVALNRLQKCPLGKY